MRDRITGQPLDVWAVIADLRTRLDRLEQMLDILDAHPPNPASVGVDSHGRGSEPLGLPSEPIPAPWHPGPWDHA